jgi:toxin ParE1/3/4
MLPFKLTVKAISDLKTIARHTEKHWGKEQRKLYLKEFDDTFHLIAETPSMGVDCDFIKEDYKKFPQGSHILYYKLGAKSKVEIVRILHKRVDVIANFTNL